MALIWFIWKMLLAQSPCYYRHLKADTSIIYVRQLILRAMFSTRKWPVYWGWNLRSLEDAIANIAKKHDASSWKITSMRIDNNSTATAVLYK